VLDTLPRLITIFSRCLIVLLPRLVVSHHVLAIFLAAAYFSHRSSILYTGSSRTASLEISKREKYPPALE
jgi:hypothetical protein